MACVRPLPPAARARESTNRRPTAAPRVRCCCPVAGCDGGRGAPCGLGCKSSSDPSLLVSILFDQNTAAVSTLFSDAPFTTLITTTSQLVTELVTSTASEVVQTATVNGSVITRSSQVQVPVTLTRTIPTQLILTSIGTRFVFFPLSRAPRVMRRKVLLAARGSLPALAALPSQTIGGGRSCS